MFLGHSLHDAHIIAEVTKRQVPTLVCVHGEPQDNGQYPLPRRDKVEYVRDVLPFAKTLVADFGTDSPRGWVNEHELIEWVASTFQP